MPTIHREDGFEVAIYTRDHPPPHVHVFDADGECIIELGSEDEPMGIRDVNGMRNRNVLRAYRIVQANRKAFLRRWREIHGF